MRKSESFKIEGHNKQFEIKELTAREIINLLQGGDDEGEENKSITDMFKDSLLPRCSNMTVDDLLDMTPSEIEEIFEKFKTVNKSFFDVARRAGLGAMLNNYLRDLTAKYSASPVNLLKRDIGTPLTTDGHTSSQPSEPID